jgi:DMSO/TMAO reductase YedYZ molybdopterin-dependent catalytic subunit
LGRVTTGGGAAELTIVPPHRAAGLPREGVRPPVAADRYAVLDFGASPMPVVSMFAPPPVRQLRDATLDIRGQDLRPRIVAWRDLRTVARRRLDAQLACEQMNWSERVLWDGLILSDVLDAVGLDAPPDGYYLFSSADGYYFESLSCAEARDPRTMLAFGMDGRPLSHAYGGPLRLVVPALDGYKSVKWLARIEVFAHDPVGIKQLLGQLDQAPHVPG